MGRACKKGKVGMVQDTDGGKDHSILTVSRPKLKVPTNFAAVTVFELMMPVVCKAGL